MKKEDDNGYPQYNYGSAFLGPNLWDRTLDSTDFNLEYMDLDEFLSENGIPLAGEDNGNAGPSATPSSPTNGKTSCYKDQFNGIFSKQILGMG